MTGKKLKVQIKNKMKNIIDFLSDKEFTQKIGKLKTPYKMLFLGLMTGFLLVGFALLNWEFGALEAGVVALIAYIPTRFIMSKIIKNKGEVVFYPQK